MVSTWLISFIKILQYCQEAQLSVATILFPGPKARGLPRKIGSVARTSCSLYLYRVKECRSSFLTRVVTRWLLSIVCDPKARGSSAIPVFSPSFHDSSARPASSHPSQHWPYLQTRLRGFLLPVPPNYQQHYGGYIDAQMEVDVPVNCFHADTHRSLRPHSSNIFFCGNQGNGQDRRINRRCTPAIEEDRGQRRPREIHCQDWLVSDGGAKDGTRRLSISSRGILGESIHRYQMAGQTSRLKQATSILRLL